MVAALWLLAALAVLASVASAYMAQSAVALTALDAATQLEMLTTAGIELAAYELSAPVTVRRPTHGGFSFRLANSSVTVEYMSETARINLNMASRTMIAGLFAALGAQARGGQPICRSGGRMAEPRRDRTRRTRRMHFIAPPD